MADTQTTPSDQNFNAAQSDGSPPLSGYSPHEHRPLGGYSTLTAIFGAAFTTGLVAAYRKRGELPERPDVWDVVTAGAATHKLTRLIAKDKVTAFLRAPFVRFEEESGRGEVSETPRGTGLQYATGELLVCPYCLAQWVAGAIAVGYVGAPRFTKLITFLYTVEAVSDFAQIGYKAAENALDSQ
jgi:Protein of unknown function (DUF1360)